MKHAIAVCLLAACSSPPATSLEFQDTQTPNKNPKTLENQDTRESPPGPKPLENQASRKPLVLPQPPPLPETLAWIAYGGADGPGSNQLSIEDELLAVSRLLGPDRGALLYAGGHGTRGVQVLDPPRAPTLLERLGAILDPRGGRDAHFEPLRLAPHFGATRDALLATLERALRSDGPRLTLWLSGHGLDGATPDLVGLTAWGLDTLYPKDLVDPLGRAQRMLRLISTTCYGGGFAHALTTAPDRACGVFAAHWTTTASGCDPDPEAPRTSYGANLLAALEGQAKADDLDRDGTLGLAEAHVHATLSQRGHDKPVLSSQFYLESLGEPPSHKAPPDPLLFEEGALLKALYDRLGVDAETFVRAEETLRADLEETEAQRDDVLDAETAALVALRGAIIARWPELEDPWRRDFAATLAAHGPALETFLDTSPEATRWATLRDRLATLDDRLAASDGRRADFELAALSREAAARYPTLDAHQRDTFWKLRRCEREPLTILPPKSP